MFSDAELLEHICAGGIRRKRAVKTLFERYEVSLIRFFRSKVSKADADDLLQNTFLKVIEKSLSMTHRENVSAWIWQVARNALIDLLRARNRELSYDDLYGDGDPIDLNSSAASAVTTTGTGFLGPYDPMRTPAITGGSTSNRSAEDCVATGLLRFRDEHPQRYYAISESINGVSATEIAHRIGRTVSATYEYLSQSRAKLSPYIELCRELLRSETAAL